METKDYNVSFFKPKTEYSRKNRNIIIWFLLIWFILIYGFQFLLRITQKPVKEQSLITYEQVKDAYFSKTADPEQNKLFISSTGAVLGKTLKPDHKSLLSEVITQAVFQNITDSAAKSDLTTTLISLEKDISELTALNNLKKKPENFSEKKENYINSINVKRNKLYALLKLQKGSLFPEDDQFSNLKILYLPYFLTTAGLAETYQPDAEAISKVMALYTTHNQSFLTDFKFFGFPFHYFYTAIFLLILFVGLCLLYSIFMKNLNIKYQIQE